MHCVVTLATVHRTPSPYKHPHKPTPKTARLSRKTQAKVPSELTKPAGQLSAEPTSPCTSSDPEAGSLLGKVARRAEGVIEALGRPFKSECGSEGCPLFRRGGGFGEPEREGIEGLRGMKARLGGGGRTVLVLPGRVAQARGEAHHGSGGPRMGLLTCFANTAISSLKDSEEQTSPPATPGSRGVHVASSHFSKISAKSGKRGCLKWGEKKGKSHQSKDPREPRGLQEAGLRAKPGLRLGEAPPPPPASELSSPARSNAPSPAQPALLPCRTRNLDPSPDTQSGLPI